MLGPAEIRLECKGQVPVGEPIIFCSDHSVWGSRPVDTPSDRCPLILVIHKSLTQPPKGHGLLILRSISCCHGPFARPLVPPLTDSLESPGTYLMTLAFQGERVTECSLNNILLFTLLLSTSVLDSTKNGLSL